MRWSQAHIPTLRDDPADAEAVSHRLLVRAGYIRQLMSGVYSLLPLAYRVRAKIKRIIEAEMDAIGAQEFLLPAIHPAELWRESGRWDVMGDEMFHIVDRRGSDLALGMTHEEVFATLAVELTSHKQLPQSWYQIQTKFRDEPRPKSGLLRVREFTMKDSYSFDIDAAGLDASFDAHHRAYEKIFRRLGLDAVAVEASSGAMGGSDSLEFVVASSAGEDLIARCPNGDYAANVQRARSGLVEVDDGERGAALETFPTPGVRTIEDLISFPGGAAAERQIKTLVYFVDGDPVLVLLRGDHALQEQKLQDGTGGLDVRPAHAEEVRAILGADPGSLGAVGVSSVRVLADHALEGRYNMTTGANRDDHHIRGVDVARDIEVAQWLDLREVSDGEPCPACGAPLQIFKGIEVGHIFKLGTKYAEAFGVTVQDERGDSKIVIMGCYGIGLERNLAAVVEAHSDERGIVWPVNVAPFEVVVTVVKGDDPATMEAAERIYAGLADEGIDVIIDDRIERPGVKFNDAELVGIPYRVTVGPRGLTEGAVEVTTRRSGESVSVDLDRVVSHVADVVRSERF